MNRAQHSNRLYESHPDTIALGQAIEERYLDLCGAYLRIRGVELKVPSALYNAFLLWREMRVRHNRCDFRNTDDEWTACTEVADWTLDVNCALRNQERKPVTYVKP